MTHTNGPHRNHQGYLLMHTDGFYMLSTHGEAFSWVRVRTDEQELVGVENIAKATFILMVVNELMRSREKREPGNGLE